MSSGWVSSDRVSGVGGNGVFRITLATHYDVVVV